MYRREKINEFSTLS